MAEEKVTMANPIVNALPGQDFVGIKHVFGAFGGTIIHNTTSVYFYHHEIDHQGRTVFRRSRTFTLLEYPLDEIVIVSVFYYQSYLILISKAIDDKHDVIFLNKNLKKTTPPFKCTFSMMETHEFGDMVSKQRLPKPTYIIAKHNFALQFDKELNSLHITSLWTTIRLIPYANDISYNQRYEEVAVAAPLLEPNLEIFTGRNYFQHTKYPIDEDVLCAVYADRQEFLYFDRKHVYSKGGLCNQCCLLGDLAEVQMMDSNTIMALLFNGSVKVLDRGCLGKWVTVIPTGFLPFTATDVFFTRTHIFLSARETGFVIIDKADLSIDFDNKEAWKNGMKFSYLKGTTSILNQPNVYQSISDVYYRKGDTEPVICYTDEQHTVISHDRAQMKVKKMVTNPVLKNPVFKGYFHKSHYIVESEGMYYIDGNVELVVDFGEGFISVIQGYAIFQSRIDTARYDETTEDIWCCPLIDWKDGEYIYDYGEHAACLYDIKDQVFVILREDIITDYIEIRGRCEFVPTNLKIIKTAKNTIDVIMFDKTNIASYRVQISKDFNVRKIASHKWNDDEPIVDVHSVGPLSQQCVCVVTIAGDAWKVDFPNNTVSHYETALSTKDIWKVSNQYHAYIDESNQLCGVSLEESVITKYSYKIKGEVLGVYDTKADKVIISTTSGLYTIGKRARSESTMILPLNGKILGHFEYDPRTAIFHMAEGLYMVDIETMEIVTSVTFQNGAQAHYNKEHEVLLIKVPMDVPDLYAIELLTYDKNLRTFVRICGVKIPHVDKVFFDPNSPIIFHTQDSIVYMLEYDNQDIVPKEISIPKLFHGKITNVQKCSDEFPIAILTDDYNLYLHKSLNSSESSMIYTHVRKFFRNDDGNILTVSVDDLHSASIKYHELETRKTKTIIRFDRSCQILWVNPSIITMVDNALEIKSGRFATVLNKCDMVYDVELTSK